MSGYPEYYIGKRCVHWSKERNERFKLYRVMGPSDHVGRYPGDVYDGKLQRWSSCSFGISFGHDIDRPATDEEINRITQKNLNI